MALTVILMFTAIFVTVMAIASGCLMLMIPAMILALFALFTVPLWD